MLKINSKMRMTMLKIVVTNSNESPKGEADSRVDLATRKITHSKSKWRRRRRTEYSDHEADQWKLVSDQSLQNL